MKRIASAVLFLAVLSVLPARAADVYTVDKTHSEATFRVKHMFSKVAGKFTGKSGLEFQLRAFVADVLQGSQVASDIRFNLLTQFREKGINIAQPVAVLQTAKS